MFFVYDLCEFSPSLFTSLLLFALLILFIQGLNLKGRTLMREKMRRDLDVIENLSPPKIGDANEEKSGEKESETAFKPSTIKVKSKGQTT